MPEHHLTNANNFPTSRSPFSRLVAVLCVALVAFPWFWPILIPPRSEFLPDFISWTVAAILLSLLMCVREQGVRVIAVGWLVAALGSAVLALMQYLDLENGFFPWIAQTQPGDVVANVHQTNMLATLLGVGLLCVWYLMTRQTLGRKNAAWMIALLLSGMAATASRTGMVHLVTIALLLFYWHWSARQRILLIVVAGVTFYLVAGWGLQLIGSALSGASINREITTRFQSDVGCHSRLVLWRNVLDMIALKPWTGWGPGGLLYAHYITPFDGARYCEKMSNAHNWPLHMAVTIGVPLTVLIHALLFRVLAHLKPWAASDSTQRLAWGVLLLIALHSLLEYPMWFGVFQLMAGLALWLLYFGRHEPLAAVGGFENVLSSRKAMGLLSTVALVFLMFLGWQYLKVSQLYLPDSWRLERFKQDTLAKAQTASMYHDHVLIAQVLVAPLSRENAHLVLAGALEALHIAPDSRIIRRVIESAELLGRQDLVELHTARYQAAWPEHYAEWQMLRAPQNARSSPPASPSAAPR